MPLRPLLIYGTRPEAVKMAPVVWECRRRAEAVEPILCSTGQHREMLAPLTDYLAIRPDVSLDVMHAGQGLSALTARLLEGLDAVVENRRPDCLVVQGDAASALAAAVVAHHRRLPLVHVEAGLRTGNLRAPWPEELYRRVADLVAALHCAPTQRAVENLLREGIPAERVHLTGNTVVDALLATLDRERANGALWTHRYAMLGDRPMVLVTGHRRESFGEGLESICRAVAELAARFPDAQFVYPVHLNPNVREPVERLLGGRGNVHLRGPADYPEFVWLMDRASLILTDSGGIQEEAPTLGKPVLVMRDTTERPEAIAAGVAQLVGTSTESIVQAASCVLRDCPNFRGTVPIFGGLSQFSLWKMGLSPSPRSRDGTVPLDPSTCSRGENPFGDGRAAERIVELMLSQGWTR